MRSFSYSWGKRVLRIIKTTVPLITTAHVYFCACVKHTQIHALGLARLDDLQLSGIFILFGAFFRHALTGEALPLERTVRVGVWTERAGVHRGERKYYDAGSL